MSSDGAGSVTSTRDPVERFHDLARHLTTDQAPPHQVTPDSRRRQPDPADDRPAPVPIYVTRPYRPAVQLVARTALWAALGLGAAGGTAALLGLTGGGDGPVAASSTDDADTTAAVPAPVTGTAELAVEEWLTATEEDRERLDELFVEPVRLPVEGGEVELQRVTTVAAHSVQDGYWVVTVRAEVLEQVDGEAQPLATWFVELGIVGDPGQGVAPLSTPGILPAPAADLDGWGSSRPSLHAPTDDDPVAGTVEGFLDALLTGRADPSPYLAPGAVVPAASAPPFADVVVQEIATEERDDGDTQVWVDATATTVGGREQPVSYELVVTPRSDRWEIAYVWGAPSLESAPTSES